MSYSRSYMDRSLDDMAEDMHHPRRERDSPDRRTEIDKDRTLFVANLNYRTSWQELKEHLRKAGPIERCDIFKDPGGYSKGFGLIVFGDAESADRALREYNDSVLNDRNMKLRKARTGGTERREHKEYPSGDSGASRRPRRDPACTVFVHNLDYSVSWHKLKDVFKVVGRVVDVEVLESRKGAAVVQFSNPDDAIKAIALFHGQMLMDRPMQVRMDSRSPYQPDPLKLKLSSLQGSVEPPSHGERSRHSRHDRHDRHDNYSRHESQYSRPRSRSPPYQMPSRDYSLSPPSRYGNGYSNSGREPNRREESYYRESEREEREPYYSRPESRGYADRSRGYERSERPRYSGRSRSRSPIRERRRSLSPEGDQEYITSVFVKNLPFSTTWQTLKDEFRRAGLVKRTEIKTNRDGRPSGLALVFYNTHKDALNAVSLFDGTDFAGRHINVQLNNMHPRPKY